mmetsp:Transcript_3822/g.15525  ORF Transcript_3822/g.15525 Transcript_3822/m.15525 type:complete len:229 (+) Transcript_3822:2229-2915(+)
MAGGRLPRISAISALTSSVGGASGGGTMELSATSASSPASELTGLTGGRLESKGAVSSAASSLTTSLTIASGADRTTGASTGGSIGPPSTGLIVPRRANQSPHALHSERTPLGPRRMSGVAWLVHPQLEHARPPFFAAPFLEDAPAAPFGPLTAGGGRGGRTGATSRSTRRASSSAMHRTASRAFAAPSPGVATRRRPSPSAPHWTKCAPAGSTQTSSGSLKRRPSAR